MVYEPDRGSQGSNLNRFRNQLKVNEAGAAFLRKNTNDIVFIFIWMFIALFNRIISTRFSSFR